LAADTEIGRGSFVDTHPLRHKPRVAAKNGRAAVVRHIRALGGMVTLRF
jgi:hypothetical protein